MSIVEIDEKVLEKSVSRLNGFAEHSVRLIDYNSIVFDTLHVLMLRYEMDSVLLNSTNPMNVFKRDDLYVAYHLFKFNYSVSTSIEEEYEKELINVIISSIINDVDRLGYLVKSMYMFKDRLGYLPYKISVGRTVNPYEKIIYLDIDSDIIGIKCSAGIKENMYVSIIEVDVDKEDILDVYSYRYSSGEYNWYYNFYENNLLDKTAELKARGVIDVEPHVFIDNVLNDIYRILDIAPDIYGYMVNDKIIEFYKDLLGIHIYIVS